MSIRHLEELLYKLVVVPLVAFLPASLAYGLACWRGDWRYRHDLVMRKQIACNLTGVLGSQLNQIELAHAIRDFFRRHSCESIDEMRLAWNGRLLARLIEIRGLEHIKEALASGKGAILCCAHFGSFNSCFSLLGASGIPVTVVGDWQSNAQQDASPLKRFFWKIGTEKRMARHRYRPNIEPRHGEIEAAMRMVEILRANEVIALPIDVPVSEKDRSRAVQVDFLGQQIYLLPGCISIAQLTGSPVLVLVLRRSADWRHQILEISPPVPQDGSVEDIFKRCVTIVEEPVRQNPAYWDYWISSQGLIELGLLSTAEQC